MANNYTLGRGELWFDRYSNQDALTTSGLRYLGNTPEFSASITSETLDHFNSDAGVKVKDGSVVLQTNVTASFTTDNVDPANLALFFFGTSEIFSTAGGAVTAEAMPSVVKGLTYQLGTTNSNPSGVRNVTGVTVKKGGTALVNNIDYTIDAALALVTILTTGSTVTTGDSLTVDYTTSAQTRERVLSGSTSVAGALKYIGKNAAGKQYDWFMPYVKLSPNGDFALKGDEWQTIGFNVEVLEKTGQKALYIDGRPA